MFARMPIGRPAWSCAEQACPRLSPSRSLAVAAAIESSHERSPRLACNDLRMAHDFFRGAENRDRMSPLLKTRHRVGLHAFLEQHARAIHVRPVQEEPRSRDRLLWIETAIEHVDDQLDLRLYLPVA